MVTRNSKVEDDHPDHRTSPRTRRRAPRPRRDAAGRPRHLADGGRRTRRPSLLSFPCPHAEGRILRKSARVKHRPITFIRPTYAGDAAGRALSVLRIASGALLMTHSVAKLFGYPASPQPGRIVHGGSLGLAGLIELVGGMLLILGFCTQPIAFLLSAGMAISYLAVHAPQGFFPQQNGGEVAILYAFTFLCLSVAGPGPWSLDARRTRSKG